MTSAIIQTQPATITRATETAASPLVAQARAEIEARYLMAMQRPRDWDTVRTKLLHECTRPGFAERAIYSIPRRGAKAGRLTGIAERVEGLTVRFAERAIALAGNLWTSVRITFDDDERRQVRVSVIELETNVPYDLDLLLDKTVERHRPGERQILSQRQNSAGETVYLCACTEDEMATKQGALVSKAIRTQALRLIPPDILEECEQEIVKTQQAQDAKDPDAARKTLCDAYFSIGVTADALKAYVGHDLAHFSDLELRDLRGLFAAIRDGEVTWPEAFAERRGPTEEKPADGKAPAGPTVKDRVAEHQRKRAAEKAAAEAKAAAAPSKPEGT